MATNHLKVNFAADLTLKGISSSIGPLSAFSLVCRVWQYDNDGSKMIPQLRRGEGKKPAGPAFPLSNIT